MCSAAIFRLHMARTGETRSTKSCCARRFRKLRRRYRTIWRKRSATTGICAMRTRSICARAIRSLEKCGISTFSYAGIVDKLSWFVGGDSYKIRQLQQKLNETGAVDHLTEDGVYGKKTHNAWLDFLDKLAHCSAPTLAWTDLTQSKLSKVKLGGTTYANNNGLTNAFLYPGKRPYIHFNPPHPNKHLTVNGKKIPIDFPHINLDENLVGHDAIYDKLFEKYNHYPLSDEAYAVLSRMDKVEKVIRIGGKSFSFEVLCWMRWS